MALHCLLSAFLFPPIMKQETIGRTAILLRHYTIQRKLQILVIDDGSIDTTSAVARTYQGVAVLRQCNAGKAAALNHGLRFATGELVACLDADSSVHPDSSTILFLIFLIVPLEQLFALFTLERHTLF